MHKVNSEFKTVQIISGEYYVTKDPREMLVTLLGSCISVCATDPFLRIGGMNHFLLPGDDNNYSARFGLYAMEKLLNELFKLGASKDRLKIKVFGGATMIKNLAHIGVKNIQFIKDFLKNDGYIIEAENLGGCDARKIKFYPCTNKVMMKKVSSIDKVKVIDEEDNYQKTLIAKPIESEIDLF